MKYLKFRERLSRLYEEKGTPIILALDYELSLLRLEKERYKSAYMTLVKQAHLLVEELADFLLAIKINRHLVLPYGLFSSEFQELLNHIKSFDLPLIMDAKVNDIGNTNRVISTYYFKAGFDALICNPLVGWSAGLEPIHQVAQSFEPQKGIIYLGFMSHADAHFGYGRLVAKTAHDKINNRLIPFYHVFTNFANEKNVDGIIVGATYPHILKEIRSLLDPAIPILSPGVGAQGGHAKNALDAGATYLIIGRKIINATNPYKELQKILGEIRKKI